MTTYVSLSDYKKLQCPFGIRDLSPVDPERPYGVAHDRCYNGNGVNKCKYFVKYDFEGDNSPCIICTCDKPKVLYQVKEQLELDFS